MNLTAAYEGCDAEHSTVLLTHQPNAAKLALQSGYEIQLVLSGAIKLILLCLPQILLFCDNIH